MAVRVIVSALLALFLTTSEVAAESADWRVCFTPGGNCTEVIIDEIGKAKREILVQAYSFTAAPIAKALIDAKRRGIDVRVVLDKSQRTEKYSGADTLANQGVVVSIDARHAIAHNKVMVIDGATVITGSFNFTKAAQERNAENLVVLHGRAIAATYIENWKDHAAHSELYHGKSQP